jgi:formylglycine-generating enzyme required for sulfatase activity
VSYAAATAACQAAGNKRLCTGDEWQMACEGNPATTYPYGANYAADSCNGAEHDTQPGAGIDNAPVATGSLAMCTSMEGTHDQSGNVKEWVNQMGSGGANIHVVRGGSYESPKLGLTCATSLSQATDSTVLPSLGFRCCSDSAP